MSDWSQIIALAATALMAGPPCQPWSFAGYRLGWVDARAQPFALLPVLAWAAQAPIVVTEEVEAFYLFDGGSAFRTWAPLWGLAGFRVHVDFEQASDARPFKRRRMFAIATRFDVDSAIRVRGLFHMLYARGLPPSPQCPYRDGCVSAQLSTQQFRDAFLVPGSDRHTQLNDPDMLPRRDKKFPRRIRCGCPVETLSAHHASSELLPRNALNDRGDCTQVVRLGRGGGGRR
jgi:hypothetical protein